MIPHGPTHTHTPTHFVYPYRQVEGQTYEQTDTRTDRQRRTDGWADGRTDKIRPTGRQIQADIDTRDTET